MTARTASAIRTGRTISTRLRARRLRCVRSSFSISTSPKLKRHLDYLIEHWEAAQAAPLSGKKLALTCGLLDAYADRLFGEQDATDDILEFRRGLASLSPELGLCLAVVRGEARLVTEAVQVPLSEYGGLSVEDFMVSLYNDHSVQRVRLVLADGTRLMAHEVVGQAVGFLSRR